MQLYNNETIVVHCSNITAHYCIVPLCNNYSGTPGLSFHCLLTLKRPSSFEVMADKDTKGKHFCE